MRVAIRQAARATFQLALAVGMLGGAYLFIPVLLLTAAGMLAVVGAGLLPETVLLLRRMAEAKRRHVASWTGHQVPDAYLPITGPLRQSLRAAVRDPATYTDIRWLV